MFTKSDNSAVDSGLVATKSLGLRIFQKNGEVSLKIGITLKSLLKNYGR